MCLSESLKSALSSVCLVSLLELVSGCIRVDPFVTSSSRNFFVTSVPKDKVKRKYISNVLDLKMSKQSVGKFVGFLKINEAIT